MCTNPILPRTYIPVKKRQGFIIFSDDSGTPITIEQALKISRLYTDLHGKKPPIEQIKKYAKMTKKQAQIETEILEMRTRICKEEPQLKENYPFIKRCENRILMNNGYRKEHLIKSYLQHIERVNKARDKASNVS